MVDDNKIVLFGAGATGRGHIGFLAWQAGYDLVFVEKRPELVERLRAAGRYEVKLYGTHAASHQVTGFRVHCASDRMAVAREIPDAALILTTVFDQNLSDVAETLALGVQLCRRSGRTSPLNCLACENMMDSSTALGRHTAEHLDGEDRSYLERVFGFPDCMISRVVPRPEGDELTIIGEDYNEWTARRESFKGEKPARLTALELVDNQTARLERKLFIHNGGHAVCGYLGFHHGHRYIHEAVADPVVAGQVVEALDELGEVVRRKHGFTAESIQAYEEDLARRGAVVEMQDEILRVVRDPVRKLSNRERMVAPALLAAAYGLPRKAIVRGIVAALKYHHPRDSQSVWLQDHLAQQGFAWVLKEVCDITPDDLLFGELEKAWLDWRI